MNKRVKKQQKDIVQSYLDDLKGVKILCANDFLEIIEQAKALKDMCFREILNGNTDLMRFFTDYSKLIIDLYDNLPTQDFSDDDKRTIEDAINILFDKSI